MSITRELKRKLIRIINPISFFRNFLFKWAGILMSDSLWHLTPDYEMFFDLVDFENNNMLLYY